MLQKNLEMLELCLNQIKALLKEPNQEVFEEVKNATVEKVLRSQKDFMK